MSTKIVEFPIPTKEESETKKLKPIKLVKFINNEMLLSSSSILDPAFNQPSDFQNVSLISKGVREDSFDIIACWDVDDSTYVGVYLGYWNDGVIE